MRLMHFPPQGCLHLSLLSPCGVKDMVPMKGILGFSDRKAQRMWLGYLSFPCLAPGLVPAAAVLALMGSMLWRGHGEQGV